MENMSIYNKYRTVPKEAQREIKAGRLKGMTDINPMWRIECLTKEFGPCGVGWYYTVDEKRLDEGTEGVTVATVEISLYVKNEGEWSMPIKGIGGSSFTAKESKGLYTSDEAFKMALTDALSVSCKALGIAADVYFSGGRTKYTQSEKVPYMNEEKLKTLIDWINAAEVDEGTITRWAKVGSLNDLTQDQYEGAVIKLRNTIEQKRVC